MTVSWGSKPARYFKRTPSTWFIVQSEYIVMLTNT